MNADRARAFLLTLPHVVETVQWGDNLVFWVGDKHLGGKMFALIDLGAAGKAVISYVAGPERFAELVEVEGLIPAPYFARIFWIAAETWSAHRDLAWHDELRAAHALTCNKLPLRVRANLDLPAADRKRLIVDRKRILKARADTPTSAPRKASSPQPSTSSRRSKIARLTKHAQDGNSFKDA